MQFIELMNIPTTIPTNNDLLDQLPQGGRTSTRRPTAGGRRSRRRSINIEPTGK
jgi:hypothetical protein